MVSHVLPHNSPLYYAKHFTESWNRMEPTSITTPQCGTGFPHLCNHHKPLLCPGQRARLARLRTRRHGRSNSPQTPRSSLPLKLRTPGAHPPHYLWKPQLQIPMSKSPSLSSLGRIIPSTSSSTTRPCSKALLSRSPTRKLEQEYVPCRLSRTLVVVRTLLCRTRRRRLGDVGVTREVSVRAEIS